MEGSVLRTCNRIRETAGGRDMHLPVIECADRLVPGSWNPVKVALGRNGDHPNTTVHHIRWIAVFFTPANEDFTYDLGRFEFNAHGESSEAPNEGPVHTRAEVSLSFRTAKPGTLRAVCFCNVHGLWESKKKIELG